ncbi:hypothetical protein M569_04536, partial [Genlisea aurea]
MPEIKDAVGLSWEPKLEFNSSAKKESRRVAIEGESSASALYRPNTELVDGLFLPPNDPRKMNRLLRKQAKDTVGKNWFDMPAQTVTPQLKKDLELLKLRSVIDPKRHYKKGDSKSKALPKYFQARATVGTVIQSSAEFYSSRLTNKERKTTLADELLSDHSFLTYRKRKVQEIEEKNRTVGVAKWKTKQKRGKKR